MTTEMPDKRILLVVMGCSLVAFIVGTELASYLYHKFAPYWFFGIEAVMSQSIEVSEGGRHFLYFSNGVYVSGMKLFPLQIVWTVLVGVLVIPMWILFTRAIIWLLTMINPVFGKQV